MSWSSAVRVGVLGGFHIRAERGAGQVGHKNRVGADLDLMSSSPVMGNAGREASEGLTTKPSSLTPKWARTTIIEEPR